MAARSKSQDSSPKSSGNGYTVLARRYRSRDFDEIIGQEPIARTLQNAIKTNRTAHAYLFCGTRGVGKTSMARIFAKALNAVDGLSQKKEIGEAILRGEDLDVIEIDGASNRGIDNARDLIAGASLSPTRSPYKIYIIDEVHMVTRDAFNALLKTMEEPPSHVKFILCTTEPHKVPATIQSRCQRFDFRAIPTAKIAEQLKMILNEEGLSADEEVIAQVAHLGNGSMRDALSLMDRLLAGGERKITMELVEEMLGLPDHTLIDELVDAIVASDPKAALDRGSELLARGATVEQALELLANHFRNLMIIAACGADVEFLDLTEESKKAAAKQAANFDAPTLVHLIAICDAVSRNARTSSAARALFDAAMVRMAMSRQFADTSAAVGAKPQAALGDGESKKKAAEVIVVPQQSRDGDAGSQRSKLPLAQGEGRGEGVANDSNEMWASRPVHAAPQSVHPHPNPLPQRERESIGAISEVKPTADADFWPRVLELASKSIGDKTRTEHLIFESFDGRTLRLSIDDSGADIARYLSRETERIADLVKRATGQSVRVELDTSRFQPRPVDGPTSTAAVTANTPPLVKKAIDLFDATLVSVEELPNRPTKSV